MYVHVCGHWRTAWVLFLRHSPIFFFLGMGAHQLGACQLDEAGWLARKPQGSVNLQGLVLALQVHTGFKMWVLGIRVAAGTDSLTMILTYLQICLCLEGPKSSERCCAEEKRVFESLGFVCFQPQCLDGATLRRLDGTTLRPCSSLPHQRVELDPYLGQLWSLKPYSPWGHNVRWQSIQYQ